MCERINNAQDYISRLILLKFDRPTKEMEDKVQRNPNDKSEEIKDYRDKIQIQLLIKKMLEDFFSHYVRLSADRCNELCLATL